MSSTAETMHSGIIEVNGARVFHEVQGSGPALLFITGGTGDAGEWSHVAPVLAQEFTVVTYDRRGFSRSPRPDGWTATSIGADLSRRLSSGLEAGTRAGSRWSRATSSSASLHGTSIQALREAVRGDERHLGPGLERRQRL